MNENTQPSRKAAQLQEAIDTISQIFEYPPTFDVDVMTKNGTKQTIIEIDTNSGRSSFELHYDGRSDDVEPELTHIE